MKIEDCLYSFVCEKECSKSCVRYVETKYLLDNSNIPKNRQKPITLTPDDVDLDAFVRLSEIRDSISDFVDNGKNLYIYSKTCGNGKTSWSIKLILQYFNEVWAGNGFTPRALFINVPTFLSKCKSVISNPDSEFETMRSRIVDVDLVVWDDIAATKLSDYDYNLLLTYIDQRVLNLKSNIYTGNIAQNRLNQYLGERLSSRICGDTTEIITLKGCDRR